MIFKYFPLMNFFLQLSGLYFDFCLKVLGRGRVLVSTPLFNVPYHDILESEFELYLRCYIHFRANTLRKGMS